MLHRHKHTLSSALVVAWFELHFSEFHRVVRASPVIPIYAFSVRLGFTVHVEAVQVALMALSVPPRSFVPTCTLASGTYVLRAEFHPDVITQRVTCGPITQVSVLCRLLIKICNWFIYLCN